MRRYNKYIISVDIDGTPAQCVCKVKQYFRALNNRVIVSSRGVAAPRTGYLRMRTRSHQVRESKDAVAAQRQLST